MKEVHIKFDDKEFELLKTASENASQSMSEYIRDTIERQSGVQLSIDFADIDEYSEQIQKYIETISGLAPVIWRSGKVSDRELDIIRDSLKEINALCNQTWRYVVDTRTKMYDETKKKLYHSVKSNGYRKRRKFASDIYDEFMD